MMNTKKDTKNKIMEVAQKLIQKNGFNAFSYADISNELGIKKASIHYHFPSKSDLGLKLIQRYREMIAQVLVQLDQSSQSPQEQLQAYVKAYQSIMNEDGRICLCIMLTGDFMTLNNDTQQVVQEFLELNQLWITRKIIEGKEQELFQSSEDPEIEATAFLSALIGSMLMARAKNHSVYFSQTGEYLIKTLF